MSEAWKKYDRPCDPCPDCGAELYEKFWGNGGWVKTDKGTDHVHSDRDCVRALKVRVASLEHLVATQGGAISDLKDTLRHWRNPCTVGRPVNRSREIMSLRASQQNDL